MPKEMFPYTAGPTNSMDVRDGGWSWSTGISAFHRHSLIILALTWVFRIN